MTLKIFNKSEENTILEKLKNQFGITSLPGIILKRGKERLFLYQGSLTKKQIYELDNTLPIERVGIYFGKIQNDKIRLSIEGTQLFKDQITKNTCELDSSEVSIWMHGQELLINTGKKDFLIMKSGEDFLGTGKVSSEKITNFIPKSRRLKFKN